MRANARANELPAVAAAIFIALALGLILLPLQFAFAKGDGTGAGTGLACNGIAFQRPTPDERRVDPSPNGSAYFLYVEFDKSVSWASGGRDDSFIEENLGKIHLVDSRGEEVAGIWCRGAYDQSDRCLVYMFTDEWLNPLSSYTVVVDAGIAAANGVDVTDREYRFDFATNGSLKDGGNVFQVVLTVSAVAAVVSGLAWQVHRRRGESR